MVIRSRAELNSTHPPGQIVNTLTIAAIQDARPMKHQLEDIMTPLKKSKACCPACKGSEFPGWKRGIRCATCDGTATAPHGTASAESPAHAAPVQPKSGAGPTHLLCRAWGHRCTNGCRGLNDCVYEDCAPTQQEGSALAPSPELDAAMEKYAAKETAKGCPVFTVDFAAGWDARGSALAAGGEFETWLYEQWEWKNWYYTMTGPAEMAVPFARRAWLAAIAASVKREA